MFKSITMEIFSKDCDEKNDDLNERRLGPISTTTNTAYISTLPVYLTALSEASCATAHY